SLSFIDLILGAAVACLATSLGSLAILPFKHTNKRINAIMLAFAAGVMAFSAVEMFGQSHKAIGDLPAAAGFLVGVLFLFAVEKTLPHIHFMLSKKELAHPKKKAALIAGSIALHNVPEGFAIAAAFANSTPLGWLVTAAISLQDVPEGLMVSAPLASYGLDKKTAIGFGIFSGIIEFAAAVVGFVLISLALAVAPAALAFSAGAMTYVVFVELLPDAFVRPQERVAAISFIIGVAIAFGLAVLLGF
ncbi:MAG: ZIP family metal transporter, partial [Candidatus Micrarchaeota archaeon]